MGCTAHMPTYTHRLTCTRAFTTPQHRAAPQISPTLVVSPSLTLFNAYDEPFPLSVTIAQSYTGVSDTTMVFTCAMVRMMSDYDYTYTTSECKIEAFWYAFDDSTYTFDGLREEAEGGEANLANSESSQGEVLRVHT